MKDRECLNLYHSAYSKSLKNPAIERSKQPPTHTRHEKGAR